MVSIKDRRHWLRIRAIPCSLMCSVTRTMPCTSTATRNTLCCPLVPPLFCALPPRIADASCLSCTAATCSSAHWKCIPGDETHNIDRLHRGAAGDPGWSTLLWSALSVAHALLDVYLRGHGSAGAVLRRARLLPSRRHRWPTSTTPGFG